MRSPRVMHAPVLPPTRPTPAIARSHAASRWQLLAVWLVLFAIASAVRLPFVLRVGPNEGGGDEWYTVWRSWSVLFEGGNPGNFYHPALFYEAGAALFAGRSLLFPSSVDLLADFVLDDAKYLQALLLLSALFGALTVPVIFELARRVAGWRAGLVAAGILAILPVHVEYSQRARVDSLCVLLTAVAMLAVHRLAERGHRRDFVAAGVLIGLATAANYTAVVLGIAYLGAALVVRRRSTSAELVRSIVLGIVAGAAVFMLTNPYFSLTPAAAVRNIVFQLSLTVWQHPYAEKTARWFYLRLLHEQSMLFAVMAACAGAWLAIRGHGFRRVLGLFPWLVLGAFTAFRTQEDRYVLIAIPWLCAAIGVLVGDALATVPRRTSIAAAGLSVILVATMTVQLWARTSPLVLVGNVGENQRTVLQRWLIGHAPPGGTVWIEADLLPLLQITFAEPGGRLQQLVQAAFRQAYPDFDARVLKGELVERVANFDPRLVTEKRIDLAVTCDRNVQYVQRPGPELATQRAFYAAIVEHGTLAFEAGGCWIAEIE